MSKGKYKIFSLALIATLICSASAYSQSLEFTHSNGSNQSTLGVGQNESFLVFVEGAAFPAVDSLELSIDVLDAGFFGTVTNPPAVVGVSGLGIFSGASTNFTPANVSASSQAEVVFSIPNSIVLADNTPVAEVFFDTTNGLSDGDVFAYGFNGDFVNNGTGERFETASVLTFFGTIEQVPEPSSAALLLALGSVIMMRRKRV